MFKVLGFRFGKSEQEKTKETVQTITPPTNVDGAATIELGLTTPGSYRVFYDVVGAILTDADLIQRYREMSLYSEVDRAIDEVINEVIVMEEAKPPVSLVINENFQSKISERLQQKIHGEFQNILRLLDFNNQAYDIVRRWYIDGRVYYHIIIDEEKPQNGIIELRYIDPRNIRKTREIYREKSPEMNADIVKTVKEYYLYNPRGFQGIGSAAVVLGIRIHPDNIAFAHSGLLNENYTSVLSHLHKALKPYNQLKMMEDSLVIYRITRAPERRIFNVDVGDLPPAKAKQYVKSIMDEYKSKLIYDATTGEIRDDRRHSTLLEDFWFPKRSDGRGSEVTTLAGGEHLDELADVDYFLKKLYRSLQIPQTRLDSTAGFNIGRSAEITREEVKFAKYVARLRNRFCHLFDTLLKTQLVLKKITTEDDWETLKENLYYDFSSDSYFAELKKMEVLKDRLDIVGTADPFVGKYFSEEYIREEILMQSDLEIKAIDKANNKSTEETPPEETPPEETPPEETPPEETPAKEDYNRFGLITRRSKVAEPLPIEIDVTPIEDDKNNKY